VKKTVLLLLLLPLLSACDSSRQQLVALARADSLRQDSLLNVKDQLLNDMLVSTQFINDINAEIAKARSLPKPKAGSALATPAEAAKIREDRADVLKKIEMVVSRLNSTESRVAQLRTQAASLARHDSTIMQQVAQYEQTIADFRQTVENQKKEFQAIFDQQNLQIASLKGQVDTLNSVKAALADSVGQLKQQTHAGYYVAGTKDDLVRDGVLVEEGHRRFWILGGRSVRPARSLDTTAFTRIDITSDTAIALPDGEYSIFSRQNPQYAQAFAVKDGKISGGLYITDPSAFWATSKFLILMKQ
jgi:predicted  nucleic acid-binding Zn-ribbon protein